MVRILNGIQNLDVYVRFLNGRPFENRPPKWIPDLGSPLCFTISWKSYKMQNTLGNLNTRLVQVKSCSIAKWSSIQMPLNEYRSYFNVVFRPPLEYWIDIQMVIYIPQAIIWIHLNTGQEKVCYLDVSVIQMLPLFRSPLYSSSVGKQRLHNKCALIFWLGLNNEMRARMGRSVGAEMIFLQ